MASNKSSNKPADNPKGNGPKLKTREEHAAAKKAAKARQARNRNKSAAKQGTYYEETHGRDRFLNRSEERAVLEDFRHQQYVKQARLAEQFDELKNLRPESTARVMADAMIQAFPDARPTTRGLAKVSKTEAAKEAALDELMKMEDNHIGRDGAIRKGAAVARAALNWAWTKFGGTLLTDRCQARVATMNITFWSPLGNTTFIHNHPSGCFLLLICKKY